jgi:hypothetical protein
MKKYRWIVIFILLCISVGVFTTQADILIDKYFNKTLQNDDS